ncbi:IS200/IS605 family accessory protein TnpB-related protein [Staphylothermus marinus]|uniref:IS200/IS605 family accessory protein TnpB-related protein n=1 Tax=Staphylothermus marinus TaxID=2280 RepID=UPI001FCC17CC|nr:IS200/IS605 family accessory protein TnpB-related protein [Staphylothermus marinus]
MRVYATVKIRAVAPNPSLHHKLYLFLRSYCDWTQYIIDNIWFEDKIPSMKKLHDKFYGLLRSMGFRAHHCHKIERRAKEIVKSVKKNRGRKPVLRKLTARIDYEDYRLDLRSKTLKIAVLDNEWIVLKLKWYSYINKYISDDWKLKEILVSFRNNNIWIYLVFEREVVFRKPRTVMGVDINFDNITYTILDMNGRLVSMGIIPFKGLRRALHYKKLAEKLQKRYPRNWRYVKWVRNVRARWLGRAKNILRDTSHYIAKKIVGIADEHNSVIVLEDLKNIKSNNKGKRFNWRINFWTYRRIQEYIYYKALIKNIPVAFIDPKYSSKKSPIGDRLIFINYRYVRLPNGFIVTRDIIASWNLALRYLRMKGSGWSMWSPDNSLNEGMKPQLKRGKPVQVSKITKITIVSKR